MPADHQIEDDPSNPISKLSAHLINENFRKLGCDAWTRDKFNRLAGKMQRTELEMAALMRITHGTLQGRLRYGFSKQDGLILTILEREYDFMFTAESGTHGLFHLMYVEKQTAAVGSN